MPEINACLFVTEGNVTQQCLRHLTRYCKHGHYVVYGHFLQFDLLSLFYPLHLDLIRKRDRTFKFTYDRWEIEGLYTKPHFCKLTKGDATITIVDSFSWFTTSLANAARIVCPNLPKLPRPKGLGKIQFREDDNDFIQYAMRDAEVAAYLGEAIDNMHHEFDLRQTVSVAHMASEIFTQNYISEQAPIYNTGPRILAGAEMSYHGGKNNLVPGMSPARHLHIDAWDLSSAYPHAMTQLPAFSKPNLFAAARVFSRRAKAVPDAGVYCVSGKAAQCDWPVIFSSASRAMTPLQEGFENQWITGFELNEALRADEVNFSKIMGHVYDADKDPVTETAMQRYVNDFYKLKSEATDPVQRFMYKVLLNSLYGKFIQKREVEDDEGTINWQPGPLYHPFIASLITGHTRAAMHQLEHYTSAIHTATDGVFCGQQNSPKDGSFPFAPAEGIGSIQSEGSDMELILLRNKCYIMYSKDQADGYPSAVRKKSFITKSATHGFQGTVRQLEYLVYNNRRKYSVEKPNTLRMAVRQHRVPNKFEKRDLTLKVAPLKVQFNHSRKGK
jgi:hypothetical protein